MQKSRHNKKKIIWLSVLLLASAFLVFIGRNFLVSSSDKDGSANIEADLKIGFVTDIEHDWVKNSPSKDNLQAKEYLEKVVKNFNSVFKPDLVINGGDYISGSKVNKDESLKQLEEVGKILQKINADKFCILGWRDLKGSSKEEAKKVLGVKKSYQSIKKNDFKIIILDTTDGELKEGDGSGLGIIGSEQVNWFKQELETEQPVIIFSHHSIIETPIYEVWRKSLKNSKEILDIIKQNNDKILAVFSGNVTQDYITKEGGVPFISAASLIGRGSEGRFAEIMINKNEDRKFEIKVRNEGENSSVYEIRRDLNVATSTRISIEKNDKKIDSEKVRWHDLEDENNKFGIISQGAGTEANINVTASGKVIAAFESDANGDKIRARAYENGAWKDLSDEKHPQGLISLSDGGNPNIAVRGEEIYVAFMEYDFGYRARVLKWADDNWEELSPGGFICKTRGHEPELAFDKDKKYLYLAYAEGIAGDDINDSEPENKKTKIRVKKWDGERWEAVAEKGMEFVSGSIGFEVDIAPSMVDNSIYIAYEELNNSHHQIKVKKWDGTTWQDLSVGDFYEKNILSLDGSSPAIAVDSHDNIYLTFIQDNEGPNWLIKFNGREWSLLGDGKISNGKTIEPSVIATLEGRIFSAYSEYKKNVVMEKIDEKSNGEKQTELIKTGAWRVRMKEWRKDGWFDCDGELNPGGYASRGSGKGDPSLAVYENEIYIIFSDEKNDYAARVKKYNYK